MRETGSSVIRCRSTGSNSRASAKSNGQFRASATGSMRGSRWGSCSGPKCPGRDIGTRSPAKSRTTRAIRPKGNAAMEPPAASHPRNRRRSITQSARGLAKASLALLAARSIPCTHVTRPWPRQASARRTRKTGKLQMDYCSSCRRHLNGALVCPGCGAYAPDIAPHAVEGRGGPFLAGTSAAPATTAHRGAAATGMTWQGGLGDDDAAISAATEGADAAEAGDPPPARQGRAARRRQLARWKKNKRRAAVASAVAIVGGGLTLAMMDRYSPDRAEAAVAPDDRSMTVAEEQTPEQDRPASAPATVQSTHRSSPTPSQSRPPVTADAPRQQSLTAPPRTAPSVAPPEAAAPARTTATRAPQAQSTAPSVDDTSLEPSDPSAGQASTPAPGDGTNPDTSQSGPALLSTSPTEVCLLGLCLS
ncbi:SCO2400 family protein [Streptomyces flaveolus]|uniref:SCO2400 family protein n=1 Tax=Streptomyces flaveolus TaxID=67297 RepID=UPI003F4D46FC